MLRFAANVVMIYIAALALFALMSAYVYGLHIVQGQMALICCAVVGIPGAYKLARSLREVGWT